MGKKFKMLNKLRSIESIYMIFLYSTILPALIGIFLLLEKNSELNFKVIVIAYFISLIFFLPILISNIKKYYFEKKVYREGKNLEILDVSLSMDDLIKPASEEFGISVYLYSFKIIYKDLNGETKEIYSEPYGIPELNYVLNFFSTQEEINKILKELQFEIKEYQNKKEVFISTLKENVTKFKCEKNRYESYIENISKETKRCEDDSVNNYIVENLNNMLKGINKKVVLNPNLSIEDKAKQEMVTGYNYNLKETYNSESIINRLSSEEYGESQIVSLVRNIAIDLKEESEIAVYVSNYSEKFKTYGLVFQIYYETK